MPYVLPTCRAQRVACASLAIALFAAPLAAQTKPTIAQFLSPSSPLELTRAKDADRVAWVAYERGMRNVYTAAAPEFRPVRLTSFMQDDGTDLSEVDLSDDGTTAIFLRGTAPNRLGWIANPSHDPTGAERTVWAFRTAGGGAPWRVAAATGASPRRAIRHAVAGGEWRHRQSPRTGHRSRRAGRCRRMPRVGIRARWRRERTWGSTRRGHDALPALSGSLPCRVQGRLQSVRHGRRRVSLPGVVRSDGSWW